MAIVMMVFCGEPLRSLVISGDVLTRALFYRFLCGTEKRKPVLYYFFLKFQSSGENIFSINCGLEKWQHRKGLNSCKVINFFLKFESYPKILWPE